MIGEYSVVGEFMVSMFVFMVENDIFIVDMTIVNRRMVVWLSLLGKLKLKCEPCIS